MRIFKQRNVIACLIFFIACFAYRVPDTHAFSFSEKTPKFLMISMADSATGWAAGLVQTGGPTENGRNESRTVWIPMILKTTDGGAHWFLQTVLQSGSSALNVLTVDAVDSRHCRMMLSDESQEKFYLLLTDDGEQWSAADFTLPDVIPRQMRFADSRNGWLVACDMFDDDQVYRTTDGGYSWIRTNLGLPGRIHFIEAGADRVWIVLQKKTEPGSVTLMKSDDNGRSWIQQSVMKPAAGERLAPLGFLRTPSSQSLVMQKIMENAAGAGRSVLAHSTDDFLSHQLYTVQYSGENSRREVYLSRFIGDATGLLAFDRQTSEDAYLDESETQYYHVIRTADNGKTWKKTGEFRLPLSDALFSGEKNIIASTGLGTMSISRDGGQQWAEAPVDFRNLYLPPGNVITASLKGLDEDILGDDSGEDHIDDSAVAAKWESLEDSLSAVSSSHLARSEKYKPDVNSAFSVGIDSLTTTTVQFHRRVRWGAKHVSLDLITEEMKSGELRIPRYKTVRFKGAVHSQNRAKARQYQWSSSINGELSQELNFSTRPDQLTPGTHFIFFKAMDPDGEWSKPVVIKMTVEEYPKYKFPFYGRWTVGGGGSYYNQGRHTRGIRYALDLNYAEGHDGGDNDFGIPVRASTDGTVIFAGYTKGYGRNVRISYSFAGKNYMTLVAHLATISVSVGDKVKQGQELGTCGSTGRSSAPHIHWELRVNDVCVAPEPIFENDTTVVQTLRNGWIYESDNYYQPGHIVIVDEPDIPGTVLEYKGYNHSYRWTGISKLKTVEARWKPKLPKSGLYKIQAHINRDHSTAIATYRIHTKSGVQEVKINQNKFTWEWATLGVFELDADDDVYVTLDNASTQRRGAVSFDAVRFVGMWEETQ